MRTVNPCATLIGLKRTFTIFFQLEQGVLQKLSNKRNDGKSRKKARNQYQRKGE